MKVGHVFMHKNTLWLREIFMVEGNRIYYRTFHRTIIEEDYNIVHLDHWFVEPTQVGTCLKSTMYRNYFKVDDSIIHNDFNEDDVNDWEKMAEKKYRQNVV